MDLKLICFFVSSHFEISEEDLFKKTRKREILIPRQIFHFLSRKHTKNTFKSIGVFSNGEHRKKIDHATVIHSVNDIQDKIDINDNFVVSSIKEIEKNIRKYMLSVHLIPVDVDLLRLAVKNTQRNHITTPNDNRGKKETVL